MSVRAAQSRPKCRTSSNCTARRQDSLRKCQSQLGIPQEFHTAIHRFSATSDFYNSPPFFILCLKCSPNKSIFSNPLCAPIFFPKSPGIPQLSLPQEQFIPRLRRLNPCRKTPIFRLPRSPFWQWFQVSNWLKITCRVCKGLVK